MCKIMMDTEKKQASPVCDNEFKEELLSKLNELRNEKILCDVTLRIEGEDFSAHRCVLSAASPYFRSMFTSGFKENESSVVELEELKSPAAASEALRFIYTGEAFVNECIAQDLVKLADYLLRASSYDPGYRDGSVSGMNFAVRSYGKFHLGYRDEKW